VNRQEGHRTMDEKDLAALVQIFEQVVAQDQDHLSPFVEDSALDHCSGSQLSQRTAACPAGVVGRLPAMGMEAHRHDQRVGLVGQVGHRCCTWHQAER
jgi:hypothetical protein